MTEFFRDTFTDDAAPRPLAGHAPELGEVWEQYSDTAGPFISAEGYIYPPVANEYTTCTSAVVLNADTLRVSMDVFFASDAVDVNNEVSIDYDSGGGTLTINVWSNGEEASYIAVSASYVETINGSTGIIFDANNSVVVELRGLAGIPEGTLESPAVIETAIIINGVEVATSVAGAVNPTGGNPFPIPDTASIYLTALTYSTLDYDSQKMLSSLVLSDGNDVTSVFWTNFLGQQELP
jgi:hypothetical protein